MITAGLIIIMNYIIMGAVLLLSFTAFSHFTAAADLASETAHDAPNNTARIKAQDNSSLQTVA